MHCLPLTSPIGLHQAIKPHHHLHANACTAVNTLQYQFVLDTPRNIKQEGYPNKLLVLFQEITKSEYDEIQGVYTHTLTAKRGPFMSLQLF